MVLLFSAYNKLSRIVEKLTLYKIRNSSFFHFSGAHKTSRFMKTVEDF